MAECTWDHVDDRVLGTDMSQEVFEAVLSVAAWYGKLGRALGVDAGDIDEIEATCNRDPQDGLVKVIDIWLKQMHNWEKYGLPTWKTLAVAVAKKSGGKSRALANEIARAHPAIQAHRTEEATLHIPATSSQVVIGNKHEPIAAQKKQARRQNKPDLKDVMEALAHVSAKWKLFGLQLGVAANKMANIQGATAEDCLLEVMTEYLDGPEPSWEGIAKALRSNSVGEVKLAKKIEDEYCEPQFASAVQATEDIVTSTVLGVCSESSAEATPLKPHTTNVVSGVETEEPKSKPTLQQSAEGNLLESSDEKTPLQADATSTEPMKLKPRLVPIPPIRMPSSGSASSDAFTSPDSANIDRQCSFPYLDTPDLSEEAKQNFTGMLLQKSGDMERSFSILMFKTRESLETQENALKTLVAALKPIKSPTVQLKDTTCKPWQEELTKATTVMDVFDAIEPYSSFFNYDIVELIIKCCGNGDDKQRLDEYKKEFEEFCKRSVCECPTDIYGKKANKDCTVTVKKIDKFEQYSVDAMKTFRYKLCKILEVSLYSLRMISVSQGCTQMQFAIFSDLTKLVFPLTEEQKLKLKEEGVISLKWKTDRDKHHIIEVASESPRFSASEVPPIIKEMQSSKAKSSAEPTASQIQEQHFQSLASSTIRSLKKTEGFRLPILANTIKHLIKSTPAAKSIEEFFIKMKLHDMSPKSFEILAHIITILGKKDDRANLAEYIKKYNIKKYNIKLASAGDISTKSNPQAATSVDLITFEDDTSIKSDPQTASASPGHKSNSKLKLEEYFDIIGHPDEAAEIKYNTTTTATIPGGVYVWGYRSTVHVPGIGSVCGEELASESAAEDSAAERAYSRMTEEDTIWEFQCLRCRLSWIGSEDIDKCRGCENYTAPYRKLKPYKLRTYPQRGQAAMLEPDTQAIREHVDLIVKEYYMYSVIYNTTMVSADAFRSTVFGPPEFCGILGDVCLTEAEAEDNAACKVYMRLLSMSGVYRKFMDKKLEEYLHQMDGPHVAPGTSDYTTRHGDWGCQSMVHVAHTGLREIGEVCPTEQAAEESAACRAYIALTRQRYETVLSDPVQPTRGEPSEEGDEEKLLSLHTSLSSPHVNK